MIAGGLSSFIIAGGLTSGSMVCGLSSVIIAGGLSCVDIAVGLTCGSIAGGLTSGIIVGGLSSVIISGRLSSIDVGLTRGSIVLQAAYLALLPVLKFSCEIFFLATKMYSQFWEDFSLFVLNHLKMFLKNIYSVYNSTYRTLPYSVHLYR